MEYCGNLTHHKTTSSAIIQPNILYKELHAQQIDTSPLKIQLTFKQCLLISILLTTSKSGIGYN